MPAYLEQPCGASGNGWRRLFAILAILVVPVLPGEASSQEICAKPLEPVCASGLVPLNNDIERHRCATDLQNYHKELGAYRDCLQSNLETTAHQRQKVKEIGDCLRAGGEDCGTLETTAGGR